MGRKQADDPKVSVSLRVRRSVLEAYQAKGANWREAMHGALERGLRTDVEALTTVAAAAIACVTKAAPSPGKITGPIGMDGKPLPARGPMQKGTKR